MICMERLTGDIVAKHRVEQHRELFFDKQRTEKQGEINRAKAERKYARKIKTQNAVKAFFEVIGRFLIALLITVISSLAVTVILTAITNNISLNEAFMNIVGKIVEWLGV